MNPDEERRRDAGRRKFRSALSDLASTSTTRAKNAFQALAGKSGSDGEWSEASLGVEELLTLERSIRARLRSAAERDAENVVQFLAVDGPQTSDLAYQFAHAVNTRSSRSLLLLSDKESLTPGGPSLLPDRHKRASAPGGVRAVPERPTGPARNRHAALDPRPDIADLGPGFQPPRHWELARIEYDLVVIDSDMRRADAALDLAMDVGGTVLVVEDSTRRRHAIEVKQALELAGANILGVVLVRDRLALPGWLDDVLT